MVQMNLQDFYSRHKHRKTVSRTIYVIIIVTYLRYFWYTMIDRLWQQPIGRSVYLLIIFGSPGLGDGRFNHSNAGAFKALFFFPYFALQWDIGLFCMRLKFSLFTSLSSHR